MLCTITHDGHHYIAAEKGYPLYEGAQRYRRPKKEHELAFRELYRGSRMGSWQHSEKGPEYVPGKSGEEQKQYIKEILNDTFGSIEDWDAFVDKEFERERNNYRARAKRFRRKAFLNDWNYFVTFTYDDKKGSEDSFKTRLRRSLSNLHSRRGWYYMGCFERSTVGRLHFHGLFHIPPGEMVGEIEERRDYSTKQHKMQTAHVNTWFEKRFGRNDFAEICADEVNRGGVLEYVLKYIEKTGERIVYSRGIPTEIKQEVGYDQCACEFFDFVRKWVLFDNWREIPNKSEDTILEGEAAEEWLICFTGYEREGYDPPDIPPFIPQKYFSFLSDQNGACGNENRLFHQVVRRPSETEKTVELSTAIAVEDR